MTIEWNNVLALAVVVKVFMSNRSSGLQKSFLSGNKICFLPRTSRQMCPLVPHLGLGFGMEE